MDYDFLIAGGGIAGAVCGRLLSERGFRCAILEREEGPFEKTCGGWVPFKAVRKMEALGWQADWLIARGAMITRAVMIEKDGMNHRYPYQVGEYGLGLRRELLHRFLISGARAAGCDVHYATPVTRVQYDGRAYRLSGFTGRRLICAIGTGWTENMNRAELYAGQSFGISEWIRGQTSLREDTVYFWYPQPARMRDAGEGADPPSSKGYFWAIPIEKGLWNIGWWDARPKGTGKVFQAAREVYVKRFFSDVQSVRRPQGAFCGNRSHAGTMPYPVLGVGDFVGCNSPDSGEGIYFAIKSAVDLCAGLTGSQSASTDIHRGEGA